MSDIYDVITIGGGPAGLICAITAVTGIPIYTSGSFKGLVIEESEIGAFAKYGKLRVTHRWFFMGHKVMDFLMIDAKEAGLVLLEHEKVIDVDLKSDIKTVETDKGVYKGKKVAICTGFFPHGNMSKYMKYVRVMFSPIELEATFLPEGAHIAILGCSFDTAELALKLKDIRPDINSLVIIGDKLEYNEKYKDLSIHYGTMKINGEIDEALDITLVDLSGKEIESKGHSRGFSRELCGAGKYDIILNAGQELSQGRARGATSVEGQGSGKKPATSSRGSRIHRKHYTNILVDYNSYTLKTGVTDFLKDRGVMLKEGYIKVDNEGNTGIPGVVAAGNIVTPVSGVITALSTGFTAGLNLHTQLYREKFNEPPLLFPWLPMGDPSRHPLYQ